MAYDMLGVLALAPDRKYLARRDNPKGPGIPASAAGTECEDLRRRMHGTLNLLDDNKIRMLSLNLKPSD